MNNMNCGRYLFCVRKKPLLRLTENDIDSLESEPKYKSGRESTTITHFFHVYCWKLQTVIKSLRLALEIAELSRENCFVELNKWTEDGEVTEACNYLRSF